MEENIPKNNSFFPLLNLELSQITNILNAIEPIHKFRNKRSINVLGTAWKYIAGTPDHDDFEMVKDIIDKNNINNNKQVLINQAFSDRINNLTTITNMLSNAIRKDNRLIDEIALLLQTKIRLVKDELKDVKNAIQWAKNSVINSSLLNKKEIDVTLSKLREENILFTSTEEALSFADIDILYNGTTLLYVVKIPLTSRENYVNIILKPVKKGNKIIKLKYDEILRNEEKIFGLLENCNQINRVKLCKKSQLTDISNELCIPALLNGLSSSCSISDGYHISTIDKISTGIILLNDFNGTVNNNTLNGTFLLKFSNSTVKINNQLYRNWRLLHR